MLTQIGGSPFLEKFKTNYSTLVAEYMVNFGLKNIPDNRVAKNTGWFV